MTARLPFYLAEDDPPAKREILTAALHLFAARGLAATSIRDIADASRYTNPALYRHFESKDALALYLFERCHRHVWTAASAALDSGRTVDEQLDAYVGCWLGLMDDMPEVIAFLADSARVLWPQASAAVRRQTMIGLARRLARGSHGLSDAPEASVDVAAAAIQGTLAELGRMIQVGATRGPARRWRNEVVAALRRVIG